MNFIPSGVVDWLSEHTILRIIVTAVLAHVVVLLLGKLSKSRLLTTLARSTDKTRTILGLVNSVIAFMIYFIAFGYILSAIGVDLSAYLASASVIALAVGFGSQGVVQDVVTGVTFVFADLFDVGEMVEISGQVGIVRHVGMRFTVIQNYSGALVYIPNRSVMNVINYPNGYVRVLVDVRLPDGETIPEGFRTSAGNAIHEAAARYPRLFLRDPVASDPPEEAGLAFIRYDVMVWPGQNPLVESVLKNMILPRLKSASPDYPDAGLIFGWEADRLTLMPTDHRERRTRRKTTDQR